MSSLPNNLYLKPHKTFYSLASLILLLASLFFYQEAHAQQQGRQNISLNDQWTFGKENESFQPVNIPHTWNDKDVMDDEGGYYRGLGIYRRKLKLDQNLKGKELFLVFNGVGQETEVLVNGKVAGKHIGSYTRFIVPISAFLTQADNEIEVRANNRFNEDIPPLTADFTFFGGIYRSVTLLAVNPVHFSLRENGSFGVFITTPTVSAQSATVQVKSTVSNTSPMAKKLQVQTTIFDTEGKVVTTNSVPQKINAGQQATLVQDLKPIHHPQLWSPASPYLYRVVTRIIDDKTKETVDEVVNPLGLRWFKFDANKGFSINDQPLKLIGASRHQDYENLGNAVPDALQIKDVELLKAMGGNFLRVAHYPQDPIILETCDRLGILASVEIPVVNTITETEAFTQNCLDMQLEMIKQNFNHPSIVVWAYMNEVLLRPKFENDKPRQQTYFEHVRVLAQKLEDLTRKADPSRYTMQVCHGSWDAYNKTGLTKIPMLVGWNLYMGWYSRNISDFGKFLDRHHQELPDKPLLITEYGADTDPRIRSFSPMRFDKSMEYGIYYHQLYLNEMLKRDFVSAGIAWNLADFSSETRDETMPHINNKGLLTLGRQPKDTYRLYQAYLSQKPYLKIASPQWTERSGIADVATITCTQPFQAVTNMKTAELFLNGKSLGIETATDYVCTWQVPFGAGSNELKVVSGTLIDKMEVDFLLQPYRFDDARIAFKQMNILLGSKRYYLAPQQQELWIPDQPYRAGAWGWIGGAPYTFVNNRFPYGSGKNIKGTDDDPIYQTQQVGIQQFKFDVPNGEYDLTLHFAELVGGVAKEGLPFNLDNSKNADANEERTFSVSINQVPFIQNLNLARDYGYASPVAKKTRVSVDNGKGITITFDASVGKPVLNAVQLRKVY